MWDDMSLVFMWMLYGSTVWREVSFCGPVNKVNVLVTVNWVVEFTLALSQPLTSTKMSFICLLHTCTDLFHWELSKLQQYNFNKIFILKSWTYKHIAHFCRHIQAVPWHSKSQMQHQEWNAYFPQESNNQKNLSHLCQTCLLAKSKIIL